MTVGTTKFDALSLAVCSRNFQEEALSLGYSSITLQYGQSDLDENKIDEATGVQWTAFRFTDEMPRHISKADLVISHCGSGTVLDVLRGPIFGPHGHSSGNLILVPNPNLMDNHQIELASELARAGAAIVATCDDIIEKLKEASQGEGRNALPAPAIGRLNEVICQSIGAALR